MIREELRPTFISFILLTLITGVFYPLSVTCVAQVLFKEQANGSLIFKNDKAVGSLLIGQQFDDPKYFWGRVSATSPVPYNAAASSGSNYGPMNADFLKGIDTRIKTIKDADPSNTAPIPVDLVTASGSGLDPHISLAAAYYQIPRIGRVRSLSEDKIKEIISRNTQDRFMGILGEPTVNVLKTNLDLDDLQSGQLQLNKPKMVQNKEEIVNWKKI